MFRSFVVRLRCGLIVLTDRWTVCITSGNVTMVVVRIVLA